MKKILFLFGCGLMLFVTEGASADGGFFTSVYRSIEAKTVRSASERVAGVLNVEPKLVETFVRSGKFTDETDHLLNVCRYESDQDALSGQQVPKLQEAECAKEILKMWDREYLIAQREVTEFQKANAFSRWWDGYLDSEEDFDIYADLHLFDRQLYGELAPPSDTPSSSKIVRDILQMAQNGYRMPADSPPFDTRGGCEKGETSLYGGLVCIPQFCTDFMCVKIKAVPGRRGVVVPGQQKEASLNNVVTDLYEISKLLHDAVQPTPTRNVNAAHWWSQLFNFDQLIKMNIHIEHKTPPILAEFATPGEQARATNYVYRWNEGGMEVEDRTDTPPEEEPEDVGNGGGDEAGTGEEEEEEEVTAEIALQQAQIRAELHRVREEEFNACQPGKQDCTSEDVLANFFEDCGLYLSRTYWGDLQRNALKCLEEKLVNLPVGPEVSDNTNLQQVKQQFYKELPENLDLLWEEVITLEKSMMSLNLCSIRQAKFRCGNKKMDCSLQGGL